MAIGFNLGDDEDRARRALEDEEWAKPALGADEEDCAPTTEQELARADHGVAAMTGAILFEALKALLDEGEGLVLDLGKCVDDLAYVRGSQWIYVSKRDDGEIHLTDMKPRDDLPHGARLRAFGKPGKLQRVHG
jgi:hypothetical protein